MEKYIVLYRNPLPNEALEGAPVEVFFCDADDKSHAIDQCEDAYPNARVWRVFVEV